MYGIKSFSQDQFSSAIFMYFFLLLTSQRGQQNVYYWTEVMGQHTNTWHTKTINDHWLHDQLKLFWPLHSPPPPPPSKHYPKRMMLYLHNSLCVKGAPITSCSSLDVLIILYIRKLALRKIYLCKFIKITNVTKKLHNLFC